MYKYVGRILNISNVDDNNGYSPCYLAVGDLEVKTSKTSVKVGDTIECGTMWESQGSFGFGHCNYTLEVVYVDTK